MMAAILEKEESSKGKPTGADVIRVLAEYQAAKNYHQRNLDNSIENWRYYYAKNPELGFGQYRLDVAQRLIAQNRALVQYNFCKPTVDALAGSLLQMKMDPAFIPINAEVTSLTEAIQKAAYSDKEMMDWNPVFLDLIVGGLIHEGCFKIVIDERYSKLGNIGLETCLPGSVIADPHWKSALSKDCKKVWHEVWLTPEEMMEKFPKEADRIQFYAKKDIKTGLTYGVNRGVTPFNGDDVISGSKLKCIQEYRVVEKKTKVAFLMQMDGDVEIPSDIKEQDIPQWLDANYPMWSPDFVYETEKTNKECRVRTICSSLFTDTFLEDGPTEVQIEATPFKFWSASRFNGEPHSIIDAIKDAQTNINYMEMMVLHKMQTEGLGGAQFADPQAFESNEEYLRYIRERNNPRAVFKLKAGSAQSNLVPVRPVSQSNFPQEAYSHLSHLINEILPHVSKVTPATLGRPETPNMSGVLYSQLKQQTDIQAYTLNFGLRNFFNDFYDGYLLQAARTYSNESVPRTFLIGGGREKITLNERISLEDGTEAIRNDASKLLEIRHKVIISEKPESPTEQMANVATYSDLMNTLAPMQSAQATVAFLKDKILQNLYQLNSDDKDNLKAIGELEMELAILTLKTNIANARVAQLQAEQGAAKLEMQMAQPQPAPMPITDLAQQQPEQQPQAMPPQSAETVPQGQGVING